MRVTPLPLNLALTRPAEPTDAQVEAAAKAMWGGDEWEAFGRCYPWDSAMPDCVEAMAQVRRGLAAAFEVLR